MLRAISCFPFLNFVGTKVSRERQSYQDMPKGSDSIGAASALLASASAPSSIWHGLGQRLVWASFWCSACARAPGYCPWSAQARRLNSAATYTSGVLGGINCNWWLARSVVLACPSWSLEGLLFVTQKLVWERASVLLVTSTWSCLYRSSAWGAATARTTVLFRGTHIYVALSTLNRQKRPKKRKFSWKGS
jgi:hypothetical protein